MEHSIASGKRDMSIMRTMRIQSGYVLLTVLLFLLMITLGASGMVQMYQTQTKREKEQQLLFAGSQIKRAIVSYYNTIPSGKSRQLPPNLEALLDDPRTSPPLHHLRQIFVDPMTGKRDWVLVVGLGGIIGVHSNSNNTPLKVSGFLPEYKSFNGAASYADWIFQIEIR